MGPGDDDLGAPTAGEAQHLENRDGGRCVEMVGIGQAKDDDPQTGVFGNIADLVQKQVTGGEKEVAVDVYDRDLGILLGRDSLPFADLAVFSEGNFFQLRTGCLANKKGDRGNCTEVDRGIEWEEQPPAKGDKKDEPRVSIRARVCADALQAAGADRVLTMDLHSPQIQGFFHIPVDHLYARNVLCQHIQAQNIPDLVVCSPDVGFAKGAAAYANLLGVPVVIGHKQRRDHTETVEVLELIGDVTGKNVMLIDDMAISAGSLISMAEVLKKRGAVDIYAAVTHGVLSNGAAQRIEKSLIKRLFITNTIENTYDGNITKIETISVASLFAKAIRSIHDRTSISMLFPDDKPAN